MYCGLFGASRQRFMALRLQAWSIRAMPWARSSNSIGTDTGSKPSNLPPWNVLLNLTVRGWQMQHDCLQKFFFWFTGLIINLLYQHAKILNTPQSPHKHQFCSTARRKWITNAALYNCQRSIKQSQIAIIFVQSLQGSDKVGFYYVSPFGQMGSFQDRTANASALGPY